MALLWPPRNTTCRGNGVAQHNGQLGPSSRASTQKFRLSDPELHACLNLSETDEREL